MTPYANKFRCQLGCCIVIIVKLRPYFSLALSLAAVSSLVMRSRSRAVQSVPASFDLLTARIRNHIRYSITTKVVITAGPALLLWESGWLLPLGVRARPCVCVRETETRLIIIKVVWLGEFISLALSRPYPTHTFIQSRQRRVDLMILLQSLRGSKSMNLNLLERHLLSVLLHMPSAASAVSRLIW